MFNYPDREKYRAAVEKQLEKNVYLHSLALEACMGALYDYFSSKNLLTTNEPPKDDWLLAGLIHDIDYVGDYKPTHPKKTKEALKECGIDLPDHIDVIVKSHAPEITGRRPQNKAEWSIFCADSLTGLIVATTLVYPSRKIADVKLSSILKRFKEPKFAAGTRREDIRQCEKAEGLNLPLAAFVEICFNAMKSVASEIGL